MTSHHASLSPADHTPTLDIPSERTFYTSSHPLRKERTFDEQLDLSKELDLLKLDTLSQEDGDDCDVTTTPL